SSTNSAATLADPPQLKRDAIRDHCHNQDEKQQVSGSSTPQLNWDRSTSVRTPLETPPAERLAYAIAGRRPRARDGGRVTPGELVDHSRRPARKRRRQGTRFRLDRLEGRVSLGRR
ncbi:hypothetical protein, partial [Glycomyces tenuis]|uniref:hypothetical protein n=1 Tax=Glycomyces tenuis TaxID=58116 RepID=UPI001B8026E5